MFERLDDLTFKEFNRTLLELHFLSAARTAEFFFHPRVIRVPVDSKATDSWHPAVQSELVNAVGALINKWRRLERMGGTRKTIRCAENHPCGSERLLPRYTPIPWRRSRSTSPQNQLLGLHRG